MTDEKKQSFTRRIANANKTEMIVVLYEMILAYAEDAKKALEEKEEEEFQKAVQRAKACVVELQNSLNLENAIAMNYFEVYLFLRRELSKAAVCSNITALNNVCDIVTEMHETYLKLSQTDTSRPVMENTQAVYAGLTYGKNSLNESLADQDIDRGFRA